MKTRRIVIETLLEEREKCWIAQVAGVKTFIPKALSERVSEFEFEVASWLAKKIEQAAG